MFGDMSKMLKKAQELQAKMSEAQEEVAQITATGVSGGGMVAITLSGKGDLKGLKIDPSLLKADEAEILEDLIIAAHADAKAKAEAAAQERLSRVTEGLPIPPGFKLPF